MTEQTAAPAVRRTITVAAPIARAFNVYTQQLGTWWPKTHHIGSQPMETAVIEPHVGGRMFERSIDGSECDWGTVLAWEPPHRLVYTWQLDAQWKFDPDPSRASEVEVRFISESAATTRVEVEHRNFERHGPGGDAIRSAVASDDGWALVMDRYAKSFGS